MPPKDVNARTYLEAAMNESAINAGSQQKIIEYVQHGVGGNCGFIVEGDISRFAEYFMRAASGGCTGLMSAEAAGGECGFSINGDFQLAWVHKFIEGGQSGNCGFILEG